MYSCIDIVDGTALSFADTEQENFHKIIPKWYTCCSGQVHFIRIFFFIHFMVNSPEIDTVVVVVEISCLIVLNRFVVLKLSVCM